MILLCDELELEIQNAMKQTLKQQAGRVTNEVC